MEDLLAVVRVAASENFTDLGHPLLTELLLLLESPAGIPARRLFSVVVASRHALSLALFKALNIAPPRDSPVRAIDRGQVTVYMP